MPTLVNAFFEKRVEQLFDLADALERAFSSAGIDYRIVGGLAAYLHIEQALPDAGRLTRDIDVAVRRQDLERIAAAVQSLGLEYRRVAGSDMLVQSTAPPARRAVHLVLVGEMVRPEYAEPVPEFGPFRKIMGMRVVSVADLVRMKLTSFQAKDEAHIKDLDEAGLITAEIEASLSPVLRSRLAQARERD